MDSTKVQPELTGYQATAAELRRIADALEVLPPPAKQLPYVAVSILPSPYSATDAQKIADVDAAALALFGSAAKTIESSPGHWYHLASGSRSNVHTTVQEPVQPPPSEADAELERLRARVAELEAKPTGLDYGRGDEGADPQPSAGRGAPHFESGREPDHNCGPACPSPCPQDDDNPRGWQG